jgi:hypothetical protein
MIERPVAFSFLAAPFLWVGAVVLNDLSRATFPFVIGAWGVCILLAAFSTSRKSYFSGAELVVFGGLLLLAAALATSSPAGTDLFLGILVGVPWILAGYVARPTSSVGLRFIAYGVALTLGLLLLATPASLAAASGTVSSGTFLHGFGTLTVDQGSVLGGFSTGAAAPTIPLQSFFDPVFTALTAVAVLGLLLVTVRPQTGRGVPLPMALRVRRESATERALSPAYGFSAAQEAVFFERSAPEPPVTAWPPGLASVLAGAVGASAFLIAAYSEPFFAILDATIAAAVSAAVLVLLTEVPGILPATGSGRRRTSRRAKRVAMLTSPSLPTAEDAPRPP